MELNPQAKETIIKTILETVQNCKAEWGRLFSETDHVHWSLTKTVEEIERILTSNKEPVADSNGSSFTYYTCQHCNRITNEVNHTDWALAKLLMNSKMKGKINE